MEQEDQGEAPTSDLGVEWVCRGRLPEGRTSKGVSKAQQAPPGEEEQREPQGRHQHK